MLGTTPVTELDFEIKWLAPAAADDPVDGATLASFRMTAGPDRIPITEVDDTLAGTVRDHIYVPVHRVARWLLVNWWRLRWEPRPSRPSYEWLQAHSMAAISSDLAWPAVQFSSDGEFIEILLEAETAPDVSAIRYLRDVTVQIPATDFEAAVDSLLERVEARLALRVPGERELSELRDELKHEREDPVLARECKLQALAGVDPGSATDEWLKTVEELSKRAGSEAMDEIMAAVPELPEGLTTVEQVISAMQCSPASVNLDWARIPLSMAPARELPWEKGARLAGELRRQLGISSGPLERREYEQWLDAKLPLPPSEWTGRKALSGGFRNGVTAGRTALMITSSREDNQRFYLARVIGAALLSSPAQHVLPVSDAGTAFQKFERSFAQEFLCPWADLDAFTDEHGMGEAGIAEAAEHFMVSERLVETTLVNKKKLPRHRSRWA